MNFEKNKTNQKFRNSGFVALTFILVIGALILVIGIAVAITSTWEVNMNKVDKNNKEALALVNSCAEIGIMKLKENSQYEGRERIAVGDYFCNISSISSISGGKTFDARAKVEDAEKRANVKVMDDSSFSITFY